MPIYEYQCGNCGEVSEVIEGVIRQEQSVLCPLCGSRSMTRLLPRGIGAPKGRLSGGSTCCGREQRCDQPPCGKGGRCDR